MTIENMNVRFFAYNDEQECACINCGNTDNDGSDVCPDCGDEMAYPDEIIEIDEQEFTERASAGERVTYERNTLRENGVSQICLTVGLPQG